MKRNSLKKLIQEMAESILSESMNVYVKGVDTTRNDRLDDLVNNVARKAILPVLNAMPSDRLEYWRRNGLGYHEMFSADGSYYSQDETGSVNTGIINFYIAGIMSGDLKLMLKNIFAELRRLGVKWGKIKKEQSGMYKSEVIRIPVIQNDATYDGPPEMNMANANARLIFKQVLQYSPDDESEDSYTFDAKELKSRIEAVLKGDTDWIKQNVRKPYDSHKDGDTTDPASSWKDKDAESQGGGARMFIAGYGGGQIKSRLIELLKIADWAIKHGHDTIYAV